MTHVAPKGDAAPAAVVAPNADDYRSEPLITRATVVAVATLVLDGVVAFVPSKALSADQRTIVVGLVSVAGTMVAAWWARRHVYSPETVHRLLVAAKVPKVPNGPKLAAPPNV